MILLIDRAVNSLFSATVKQYGSQANSLAVDSSDVDLAVTAYNLGNSQSQFNWMGRLFQHLQTLSVLKSSEFIHTASVPVIKLKADLQLVQEILRNTQQAQTEEGGEAQTFIHID